MMTEVVSVSTVDRLDKAKEQITAYFGKGQYEEITEAIGMHSLFIDPQHTITDQRQLYRSVLDLLKNKISGRGTKFSSSWLVAFPALLTTIIKSSQIVTTTFAVDTVASQFAAYGPFKSVDGFFFWALEDRRLPLGQIVRYIEKTAEMHVAQHASR